MDSFSTDNSDVRDGGINAEEVYGIFEGKRNGRWFTDFPEETFEDFLMNDSAKVNGISDMTLDEINEEIAQYRIERGNR